MKLLLIHQNFPGQFKHLATHFASQPGNQVVAICQDYAPGLNDPAYARVARRVYKPHRTPTDQIHHYVRHFEEAVLNGQAVAKLAHNLKRQGFVPDVIFAHSGWGEALYLKDIFPDRPLIAFSEFYYHAEGVDADFDPEYPITSDDHLRIRTRNAIPLLSLAACDQAVSPTKWQKDLFPKEYHSKIKVLHEGIDTDTAVPDPKVSLTLPNGKTLTRKTPVITYCARSLEPYRGFHVFMRALPEICHKHPEAQILITGGDDVSYGARLPDGQSYREKLLHEVKINPQQVHFLGNVDYQTYLKVLQISAAHIYLTVPFVLSWSIMEAMSAQCIVIASDTAPVRELIKHGKNGLLVDFFDKAALINAVDEALCGKGNVSALAKHGRKTILKNYHLTTALEKYSTLFADAMVESGYPAGSLPFAKAS